MWNKKIVSLLNNFLQAFSRSGLLFMSVLKIVHKLTGSHNKVIYMNFFVDSTTGADPDFKFDFGEALL